jgi:hypothetical protein
MRFVLTKVTEPSAFKILVSFQDNLPMLSEHHKYFGETER